MQGLTVEIPYEALSALKLPHGRAQEELRHEFAVFLVREGLLPRPQARLVAQMTRLDFEDLLVRRKVPIEIDVEDLLNEVQSATTLLEDG